MEQQPIKPELPITKPNKKLLPKKVGLAQMMQKTYGDVPKLTAEMLATLGEIEDAFDMICWGDSGQGKTNFNMEVMCQFVIALDCKATYISWEEGHGKSLRNTSGKTESFTNAWAIGWRYWMAAHLNRCMI